MVRNRHRIEAYFMWVLWRIFERTSFWLIKRGNKNGKV